MTLLHFLRHYLEHWMALDSQNTGFYMFWSGIGAASAGWFAIFLAYFVFRAEMRLEKRALELEERLLDLECASAGREPGSRPSRRTI